MNEKKTNNRIHSQSTVKIESEKKWAKKRATKIDDTKIASSLSCYTFSHSPTKVNANDIIIIMIIVVSFIAIYAWIVCFVSHLLLLVAAIDSLMATEANTISAQLDKRAFVLDLMVDRLLIQWIIVSVFFSQHILLLPSPSHRCKLFSNETVTHSPVNWLDIFVASCIRSVSSSIYIFFPLAMPKWRLARVPNWSATIACAYAMHATYKPFSISYYWGHWKR